MATPYSLSLYYVENSMLDGHGSGQTDCRKETMKYFWLNIDKVIATLKIEGRETVSPVL